MDKTGSSGPSVRRPDVFLVVTDTTRRDVFSGGAQAAPGQGFLDELREQCWVHPKAIATAPWTAPSHASLFTGGQLWDHHLHLRRERSLPPDQTTLAQSLAALGYRTACFAANDYIGPGTGLIRGFQDWCSGGKQDWLLRGFHGPPTRGSELGWRAQLRRTAHPSRLIYYGLHEPVWTYASRWPALPGKLGELIAPHAEGLEGRTVAGWIDGELRRWLATIPPEQPVFVFLNYMESHEPYLGLRANGEVADAPGPTRQDARGWASGAWVPTEAQLESLHRLYRLTFPALNRRLRDLVGYLRQVGRWQNSLFVLTSDHGQALGEDGVLLHGLRTAEPLVRVPLWIRPPPRTRIPLASDAWTSLASVRSVIETMVRAAGDDQPESSRAVAAAEDPVVTIADGVGGLIRPVMSAERLAQLDRISVSGYQGPRKLTLDVASGRCTLVDFDKDPEALHPIEVVPSGDLQALHNLLQYAAAHTFPASTDPGARIDSRLASWGY